MPKQNRHVTSNKKTPAVCPCPSCCLKKSSSDNVKGAPPKLPNPGSTGTPNPNLRNKPVPVGMRQIYREVPKEALKIPKVT